MSRYLPDHITLDQLADDIERHPSTVMRWTQLPEKPLPYTKIGKAIFFHLPTWHAWVADHMRHRNPADRGRRKR